MKRWLDISTDVQLPTVEAVTQTIVVYGGKGMGKTNLGAVICEELSKAGKRFCFVDPVGVAWGLRHSADGEGEGIKLIILGGRHGDLPIEPTGGSVVADFIADSVDNVLLDISSRVDGRRWSNPEKIKFVADYLTRLLERQGEHRHPIMQVIDEAARFAPQMMRKGAKESERCLDALEVLVEEGRNAGVGVMLLTQRSARMAKSVSELAEMMVSFRIIGPNSTEAVLDWFGAHVPKANHLALLEQLRKLPRGNALVVSPGWLEYEGVAAIRLRETFDSSKTPTGTERKLAKRVRPGDLEALRMKIAETVERAEQQDASKLRPKMQQLETRVRQLEAENTKLKEREPVIVTKISRADDHRAAKLTAVSIELTRHRRALEAVMKFLVKVKAVNFDGRQKAAFEASITDAVKKIVDGIEKRVQGHVATVEGLKTAAEQSETAIRELLAQTVELTIKVEKQPPFKVSSPTVPPIGKATRAARQRGDGVDVSLNGDKKLKKGARDILTALASAQPEPMTRAQLGLLCGIKSTGSTMSTYMSNLRLASYITEHAEDVWITEEGLSYFGVDRPDPMTKAQALAKWMTRLKKGAREILNDLKDAYPEWRARADLAETLNINAEGSTLSTYLSNLRRAGLIEERGDEVRFNSELA